MLTRSDAPLYESANSLIYRLPPGEYDSPAILKILKTDYPPPERIAQFNNEFELTKDLDGAGIRRAYRRDKVDGRHGIVLEYIEAQTLREAFAGGRQPLVTFLDVAVKIAEALQQIHDAGIVHKDINSGNILVNLETGAVKIIDFGISSRVELHTHHLGNPARLEGTLAYISPEQTGRMNRVVDYRTDFYSLGVTFHEILTGQLPFPSTEPMDLVHSHIARNPEPVHRIREDLPEVLSSIVGRLMAKDADDRYQSALGLQADLEECRRQWEKGQRIVAFTLGTKDVAARFQVPQKLYGRQGETAELLEAFDRVARGAMEMVLVRGYSGVGKSALVSEIHKPVTLKRGHFVDGKYDQYKRNIPYSAIGQALGDFCGYLLAESEEALAGWRKRIQRAVGENGQLLVDIVPSLELVLGEQPPVAKLPPPETLARFLLVFQRFIAAISREDHPLVLFLDDLQWADSASLHLIKALLTDEENRHLLLVGAYRDNEVEAGHPLTVMQDEARQEGAALSFIDLQPLGLEHLSELLRDTTHADDVQALAELVEAKTGGNAFFAHQFLKALHEQGLLTFDAAGRTWTADVARIRQSGMTDNVVELMAGKIRALPTSTQDVLRLASCIGNTFDLETLRLVREDEEPPTSSALWRLVEEGLILPLDDSYKLLPVADPARTDTNVTLRFLHDRVQQAAYSLIPPEEQPATHLRIGRLLLESTPDPHESVFEVVSQLNKGIELITSPEEKVLLAGLNLQAGQRAKESTANLAARAHATVALSLLTPEDWRRNYRLAFDSHLLGAEAHYLTGDFARAEELIHRCLQNADDAYDKADVYSLLMLRQTMSSQYAEAIESARQALALLDFELPHADLSARIAEEMGWLLQHFEANGMEGLDDGPDMEARDKLATMKVLDNLSAPTYVSGQTELWILHVLLKVRLSIEHGNCPETGYAFSELGLIFCILGPAQYGFPAGELSRRLGEKFKDVSLRHKARSLHLIANYITPWFKHFAETESTNAESYQASLESGELIFAGYTVFHPFYNWFTTGATSLGELLEKIPSSQAFSKKIRHDLAFNSLRGMELLVANLQGATADRETFRSGDLDEAGFLRTCNDDRDFYSIALFHVFKAKVLYLYRDLDQALESFRKTIDLAGPLSGHAAALGTRNATHSLILLGLCDDAEPAARKAHLDEVEGNQEQLRAWAENCPENFAHKHLLVEAEKARVLGQKDEALRLYIESIHSAQENAFVHEEALANELAARYWLGEGNAIYARAHLLEARYGYQRWGATRKVEQLDAEHPLLLGGTERKGSTLTSTTSTSTTTTTGSSAAETLDVVTVVKASQALSGEMVLASLLEKMTRIVMESAGAQKAALLLEKDGHWYVEAEGTVDGTEVQVLQSVPLEDAGSLPASILNSVVRTRREILRDDPARDGVFSRDAYLRRVQPRSVLAMPLVHQGNLGGLLYLENDLTAGAFTPDRVELLRLLSSQMAVSIANARLYENVSELSRAYRRFVPHEFLRTLGHESILNVRLGDQIRQEMTVLFSDIRSYTTLSEGMTPEENFNFINAYLKRVGPAIKRNGGFINQYYGDGIMAIFPNRPEDALRGALEVLKKLAAYNVERERKGRQPIHMGVGLHTGKLMLGVIGDEDRHDTGVISDAVNTAARVEGLTKIYGASIILSEDCRLGIPDIESYGHRFLGRVQVKGRAQALAVYEFYDGEPEEIIALKQQTKDLLAQALDDYFAKRFPEAAVSLKKVLESFPGDKTARRYLENAARYMVEGVEDGWSGVEKMTEK
ncbi:MAG: AAA family ATPase [Acidobacteria bacterium]|nr:AAA family ATPase [Acidobacteriota bacterium]